MTMKEIAYKIEELQIKAEKIHSLNEALFAAIYCQNEFSKKTYEWAFVSFSDMTMELRNELEDLTNKAFDSFRQDAA